MQNLLSRYGEPLRNTTGHYMCQRAGFCEAKHADSLPISKWVNKYLLFNSAKEPINTLTSLMMTLIHLFFLYQNMTKNIMTVAIRVYLVINSVFSFFYHKDLINFAGIFDSSSMIQTMFLGSLYSIFVIPFNFLLKCLLFCVTSLIHLFFTVTDTMGCNCSLTTDMFISWGLILLMMIYANIDLDLHIGHFIFWHIIRTAISVVSREVDYRYPTEKVSKYYLHGIFHVLISLETNLLLDHLSFLEISYQLL